MPMAVDSRTLDYLRPSHYYEKPSQPVSNMGGYPYVCGTPYMMPPQPPIYPPPPMQPPVFYMVHTTPGQWSQPSQNQFQGSNPLSQMASMMPQQQVVQEITKSKEDGEIEKSIKVTSEVKEPQKELNLIENLKRLQKANQSVK